jgi:predicted P-loop ATPase/GTPase
MSSTQHGGSTATTVVSQESSSSSSSSSQQQISRVPTYACFQHATKVAILEDKPIILDYWTSSLDKTCLIGVRSNNEKLLVKSEDEYTSPIAKIFKVDTEYIIVTANSVYIVAADISTRRIN